MKKISCALLLASSLFVSGPLSAEQVSVSAQESRRVVEVLVKEGDRVEAGQVLARLESEREDIENAIVHAKADVVKAELDLAADALKRQEELYQQDVISESQLTQAKLKFATMQAKYKVSLKEVELADYKMRRFELRSPVEGELTRFSVRPGDAIQAGDEEAILIENA